MKSNDNMEDSSANFDSNHGSNQETPSSFSLFENLPEELGQKVFSYCPLAKDRMTLMQVSGQFASSVAALEAHEYSKPKYFGMAGGTNHSLALTEEGKIFSCGNNRYGQLGQGDKQGRVTFTEVPGLKGHRFIQIAANGFYSLALTEDGKIFGCGSNSYGQLGQGDQQDRAVFTEVPGLKGHRFIQIAAGYFHNLALTEEGKIFGCGSNSYHELGQGDNQNKAVFTEAPGLKEHRFIQIAAGQDHSLALTEDGKIFSCGHNRYGQLGQGDTKGRAVFTEVPGFKGQCFTQIVAVEYHSLALTEQGSIFSCGGNFYGQLGQGDQQNRAVLTEVPGFEGQCFTQISGGGYGHSLALSEGGKVFSCGNGSNGALGLGVLEGGKEAQPAFKEVKELKNKVIGIAAGYDHSMVLTEEGQVFTCGYNEKGELGLGSKEKQTTFQPVPNLRLPRAPLKLPEKLKAPAI